MLVNTPDKFDRRKRELIRENRQKLPSWHAAQKLMDYGALTDDDCRLIYRKLGPAKGTQLLYQLGYPGLDYTPADNGEPPKGAE